MGKRGLEMIDRGMLPEELRDLPSYVEPFHLPGFDR